MALFIVDGRGNEVPFSLEKFSASLARRWSLSGPLATAVARRARHRLRKPGTDVRVDKAGLEAAAGHAAAEVLGQTRGGGGGGVLKSIPGADLAPGAIEFVKWLIEYLKGKGWVDDDDVFGDLVKETGGFPEDSLAPTITGIEASVSGCCTQPGPKGVQVTATVTATDTGGFGNCSGIGEVRLVAPGVFGGRLVMNPSTSVTPSEEDSDKSEDEDIRVTLSLCIPCEFLEGNQVVLLIQVTDRDGNGRIRLHRVPLSDERRRECCDG